jgi:hypothetical protein
VTRSTKTCDCHLTAKMKQHADPVSHTSQVSHWLDTSVHAGQSHTGGVQVSHAGEVSHWHTLVRCHAGQLTRWSGVTLAHAGQVSHVGQVVWCHTLAHAGQVVRCHTTRGQVSHTGQVSHAGLVSHTGLHHITYLARLNTCCCMEFMEWQSRCKVLKPCLRERISRKGTVPSSSLQV